MPAGAREGIDVRRFAGFGPSASGVLQVNVRKRLEGPRLRASTHRVAGRRPPAIPAAVSGFSRSARSASSSATSERARSTRFRPRSASSRKPGLRRADVIGVVSLIIWALLIVVTAKYVVFLMQADNKGEGGILSLKALAQRALGQTHNDRLPARRGRLGALFRRRDHHAGDLGPLGARGPEAGRRRPGALHPAGDGRHSRAAVHRAEPRHGRASPRSSVRSWWCSSS